MGPGVDLVIFGASGDLAQRKILPSLKRLASRDGMPLRLIGVGRAAQPTTHFRSYREKCDVSGTEPCRKRDKFSTAPSALGSPRGRYSKYVSSCR